MYYPYFRGKQYELIAIRENAHRMGSMIVPIIEPVKQATGSLRRALEALIEHECRFVVVANPRCGDFANMADALHGELRDIGLEEYDNWSVACIADGDTTREEIATVADLHSDVSVIHAGFHSAATLTEYLEPVEGLSQYIFIDGASSGLYRRRFRDRDRILIHDGFEVRTNRDHPDIEHFSDLHATYSDQGMDGFGDYLIVGGEYSDTGGPAYAVAIHLAFIDPAEDDDMFVKHYVSDRQTSPVDPGGKFLEALVKLVRDAGREDTCILQSDAVAEFRDLHARGHYPGLGYVKKLSMQHHIELMADFMARDAGP